MHTNTQNSCTALENSGDLINLTENSDISTHASKTKATDVRVTRVTVFQRVEGSYM